MEAGDKCATCESTVGFTQSYDGFFYCSVCGAQAHDQIATEIDHDAIYKYYSKTHSRPCHTTAEPISQVKPSAPSQYFDHPTTLFDEFEKEVVAADVVGPTQPSDFGSSQQRDITYEEYYSAIRSRYLCGIQIMIQLQCRALVERFNVSPLIVGLVGPIWLRLLASTRIMNDDLGEKVHDFENQTREPIKNNDRRLVMMLYNSISNNIPTFYSLAITILACHVAREAILPTDILKWSLEENLPYFAAFGEIEKNLGPNSNACPISASRMFRPIRDISSQKLESMAANIAKRIGLDLPPVNFYAIASRYCKQLSLPIREILPMACRISEWSMPPELYLSSNEFRIPSRASVMSILIVAIRILFDINGYGMWESSLSSPSSVSNNEETEPRGNESDIQDSKLNVVKLLQILEAKYNDLDDEYDYSDNLPSYLKHCKDVQYSGLEPKEPEEIKIITELWDFYNKFTGTSNDDEVDSPLSKNKRSRNDTNGNRDNVRSNDDESTPSTSQDDSSRKERAIRKMKLDMEENQFCYISPRTKVKCKDYLHYARKRKDVYIYAVHADYYVLLRSCAKVAQVKTRVMHIAVLSFERRLKCLEKRIHESLHYKQNDVCDFCCDE